MWIIILLMLIVTFAGLYIGQSAGFRLQTLDKNTLLNASLITLALFTLLIILHNFGYFPQWIAAPFMMGVYSLAGGFFLGYAFRIYTLRVRSGKILFQYRSFWIDHAPNLLAVILILFGIYRTSILLETPVTGIRLTSGMSLICFGLSIWTLKAVPEFRVRGIFFLDTLIPWEYVVSWNWYSETILHIDYMLKQKAKGEEELRITELSTYIPEEDKKNVERILQERTDDFSELRLKILSSDSDEME